MRQIVLVIKLEETHEDCEQDTNARMQKFTVGNIPKAACLVKRTRDNFVAVWIIESNRVYNVSMSLNRKE